ncbi:isochorismatase family protein [Alteromonas gilva]|uniref:Isochorismatase family protein n=1 Tax=Alteromonas gilva TaxID=2987522 RepID=A0ABT5L3F8_9ALTE|nr:isochorismatase family protein [Alteromonas gilva]MDC8831418.1 isochorismatase family protein [Alteromonas gilva]
MLERQKAGVLVVDVQGKLARSVADSERMINHLASLIKGAQQLGLPIIQVEQLPDKLGATVPELQLLLPPGTALEKSTFSALRNERVEQQLHATGRTQWLICGIEAHICVYQSAIDLLAYGSEVHIVTDAVSARNPDHKTLALNKLQAAGAHLTCLEMALFELLERAGTDEFKAILPLIK